MKKKVADIVVEVRGGNVVAVYSDKPVRIRVLDWDNIEEDPANLQLAQDFGLPEPLPYWLTERVSLG